MTLKNHIVPSSLLRAAAAQLVSLAECDRDAPACYPEMLRLLERWADAKLPGHRRVRELADQLVKVRDGDRWTPGRGPAKPATPEPPPAGRGIALAWANLRRTTQPRTMLALDDGEGWTIFWSIEHALKDRLDDGYDTATIRPCRIAFPDAQAMDSVVDDLMARLHEEPEDVAQWSDFADQDGEIVEYQPPWRTAVEYQAVAERDLAAMLAATFRAWAEKHGCYDAPGCGGVHIRAWKFTGPERRFTHTPAQGWTEEGA